MHTHEIAELAALAAVHGPVLVREAAPISAWNLQQYWVASQARLDCWNRALAENCPSAAEEVLVSEMVARAWAATLCAYDRRQGMEVAGPIGRRVFDGHLEMRRRVLRLLVHESDQGNREVAQRLDRTRRRAERWTDMLIGYLLGLDDVSEFAFDADQARDFSEDVRFRDRFGGGSDAWGLIVPSIRAAFRTGMPETASARFSRRIAGAILACFRPELFDATGVPDSLWQMRLTNTVADVEGLVDEWLAI